MFAWEEWETAWVGFLGPGRISEGHSSEAILGYLERQDGGDRGQV